MIPSRNVCYTTGVAYKHKSKHQVALKVSLDGDTVWTWGALAALQDNVI